MQEQGERRVASLPEPRGIGVVERADQQFRRLTASVSSREGKYSPPVTEVRASSRKLFPCRRLPLTTPSSALRTGFDAKETRPFHSRSRSNTRSGFGIMRPPLRRVL